MPLIHINPMLTLAVDALQERHDSNASFDAPVGVSTGLKNLDKALSGLNRGDLVLVGGRPSVGKTSLALTIACHIAVEEHLPVAYFSTETSGVELAIRVMANIGRINGTQLRQGALTDDEWSRLSFALGKTHDAPIYVSESGISLRTLEDEARQLKGATGGLGLIVVDRIHSLAQSLEANSRADEVAAIAAKLKALALELDCPILATASLSRSLESRLDRRPTLTDLRDSGALEDEADAVLLLHQEASKKWWTDIYIAKNRRGEESTLQTVFLSDYGRHEIQAEPSDELTSTGVNKSLTANLTRKRNVAKRSK